MTQICNVTHFLHNSQRKLDCRSGKNNRNLWHTFWTAHIMLQDFPMFEIVCWVNHVSTRKHSSRVRTDCQSDLHSGGGGRACTPLDTLPTPAYPTPWTHYPPDSLPPERTCDQVGTWDQRYPTLLPLWRDRRLWKHKTVFYCNRTRCTPKWLYSLDGIMYCRLHSNIPVDTICITLEDYCQDFVHLKDKFYQVLLTRAQHKIVIDYMKVLFSRYVKLLDRTVIEFVRSFLLQFQIQIIKQY